VSCGYSEDRVFVTGSPRFDQLPLADTARPVSGRANSELRLLLVGGLTKAADVEMLDAVSTAAAALSGIRLRFRSHPFNRIEQTPEFLRFQDRVEVTHASLEEDLEDSDIVIFTYSTVAEQAFLLGKDVWQWFTTGFNGSALAEVAEIRAFGSVASLTTALRSFQAAPARRNFSRPERQTRASCSSYFMQMTATPRRVSLIYAADC
jgi:hypothetical protein